MEGGKGKECKGMRERESESREGKWGWKKEGKGKRVGLSLVYREI